MGKALVRYKVRMKKGFQSNVPSITMNPIKEAQRKRRMCCAVLLYQIKKLAHTRKLKFAQANRFVRTTPENQ